MRSLITPALNFNSSSQKYHKSPSSRQHRERRRKIGKNESVRKLIHRCWVSTSECAISLWIRNGLPFVCCMPKWTFFFFFFLRWFVFRFERWACSGRLIHSLTRIRVCHRIRRPYSFLVGYFLFIYLFRNLLCSFFLSSFHYCWTHSCCVFFFVLIFSRSIHLFLLLSCSCCTSAFISSSFGAFVYIPLYGKGESWQKKEWGRKRRDRICKQINNTPVVSVSV